jgi:hypothetical protein
MMCTATFKLKCVVGCIWQLHIVQLVVGFGPQCMVPRFRIDPKEIAGKHLAVPHTNEWAESVEVEWCDLGPAFVECTQKI